MNCWRRTQPIGSRTADADPDFEELRDRGYDGGYYAVRRYARRWSKERAHFVKTGQRFRQLQDSSFAKSRTAWYWFSVA
jgi:hypothetical protein